MRTRGVIVREAPGQYEVVDLEVDDPRPDEIQVQLVASGLCHSDDHLVVGDSIAGTYPMALGHEGAGIVTKVGGANSKGVQEGDHVVLNTMPSCGHCRWCASGRQSLCDLGASVFYGSRWNDTGSYRLRLPDGTPVGQICGISTFCETTTVGIESVVKIEDDLPLEKACLVGCGVSTGWGSAVNAAEVRPGHTVIVMGVGGVGINAVQGAAHAGASNIIAVDPVSMKREKATELGATESFGSIEEAAERARALTHGQGADSVIVTVGVTRPQHVAEAFAAVRKAGTVVVVGLGNMNEVGIPISMSELTLYQKRLQGALFGMSSGNWDIQAQLQLYRDGILKLDELVTTTYTLDDVAQGYQDMHDGKNIRGVVLFDR